MHISSTANQAGECERRAAAAPVARSAPASLFFSAQLGL